MIILPDTQVYAKSDAGLQILTRMLNWIRNHREPLGIQTVLHVGDIVDDNSIQQWQRIRSAFSRLDGKLSYLLAAGNHDMGENGLAKTRDTALYRETFRPTENPATTPHLGESFRGQTENSYYFFSWGKEKFLILLLEFGPRNSVLNWANQVLRRHPDHRVIVVTHEYMDEKSRLLSATKTPERSNRDTYGNAHHYELKIPLGYASFLEDASVNNGEELWRKLLNQHANVEFVFSGHYDDYDDNSPTSNLKLSDGAAHAYRADRNAAGGMVHQFMYDAQWVPSGGDGWMLLVEFGCDGQKAARVQSFSPLVMEKQILPSTQSVKPLTLWIPRE